MRAADLGDNLPLGTIAGGDRFLPGPVDSWTPSSAWRWCERCDHAIPSNSFEWHMGFVHKLGPGDRRR